MLINKYYEGEWNSKFYFQETVTLQGFRLAHNPVKNLFSVRSSQSQENSEQNISTNKQVHFL